MHTQRTYGPWSHEQRCTQQSTMLWQDQLLEPWEMKTQPELYLAFSCFEQAQRNITNHSCLALIHVTRVVIPLTERVWKILIPSPDASLTAHRFHASASKTRDISKAPWLCMHALVYFMPVPSGEELHVMTVRVHLLTGTYDRYISWFSPHVFTAKSPSSMHVSIHIYSQVG